MDSAPEQRKPFRKRTCEWYEHMPRWLRRFMWWCVAAVMGLVVTGLAGVVVRGEFSSFIVDIIRACVPVFGGGV